MIIEINEKARRLALKKGFTTIVVDAHKANLC